MTNTSIQSVVNIENKINELVDSRSRLNRNSPSYRSTVANYDIQILMCEDDLANLLVALTD